MKGYVMITTDRGISFAGLEKECKDRQWRSIKPSSGSETEIYFAADHIMSVIHQDGTKEEYQAGNDKEKQNMQRTKDGTPEGETVMIRVKGGVSYRGTQTDAITEKPDGHWLKPSAEGDIIIYVPEKEAEKVYRL